MWEMRKGNVFKMILNFWDEFQCATSKIREKEHVRRQDQKFRFSHGKWLIQEAKPFSISQMLSRD